MEQMNITSAKYYADKIDGDISCVLATIDGQKMSVPLDPANRHFSEIMRQVEEGTLVIQEADNDNS